MLIQCIKSFIYFTHLVDKSGTYNLVRPDATRPVSMSQFLKTLHNA